MYCFKNTLYWNCSTSTRRGSDMSTYVFKKENSHYIERLFPEGRFYSRVHFSTLLLHSLPAPMLLRLCPPPP